MGASRQALLGVELLEARVKIQRTAREVEECGGACLQRGLVRGSHTRHGLQLRGVAQQRVLGDRRQVLHPRVHDGVVHVAQHDDDGLVRKHAKRALRGVGWVAAVHDQRGGQLVVTDGQGGLKALCADLEVAVIVGGAS